MLNRSPALLAILVLIWTGPAYAGLPLGQPSSSLTASGLTASGEAVVKSVISGDLLELADGRIVRLAGIQAPKIASSHGRGRKGPLAEEVRAVLERLALGQPVTLFLGAVHQDRHDRLLAQLVRDDGLWLQGEMLSQGWARVHVLADSHALVAKLLAAEAPAREARLGIWGNPAYAIRTPNTLGHDADTFQVVEGLILNATLIKGQLYLNFGPDWRTDFTVRVPRRTMKSFRQIYDHPQQLQGRMIRVRGWVYRHNGPEIEITAPDQLELTTPGPVVPAPATP
ncbi:MAG: thermonuclease family protein [Rhodospirillaceae bacterium]